MLNVIKIFFKINEMMIDVNWNKYCLTVHRSIGFTCWRCFDYVDQNSQLSVIKPNKVISEWRAFGRIDQVGPTRSLSNKLMEKVLFFHFNLKVWSKSQNLKGFVRKFKRKTVYETTRILQNMLGAHYRKYSSSRNLIGLFRAVL